MAQLLAGHMLVLQDGTKVPAEEYLSGKLTLLYFSASWCGPCHQFTPILKKFYEQLKAEGKCLEVVFISGDESAEEQQKYFHDVHGQWARLEFDDPANKEFDDKFDVAGIPSLKLIRPNGSVVIDDADSHLRPSGRYCDVCRDQVGDSWFTCLDCEDYDLCRKCKTHLVLSAEHKFEEKKQSDCIKAADQIWTSWMEAYEKKAENASDGKNGGEQKEENGQEEEEKQQVPNQQ